MTPTANDITTTKQYSSIINFIMPLITVYIRRSEGL